MTPDLINALFEFVGAGLVLMNVRQLFIDKRLCGVHWYPTAFFSAWGFWNLYYYPALDQWLSFAGGVALVLANTAWVVLALYYLQQERSRHMGTPNRTAVRGGVPHVIDLISSGGAGRHDSPGTAQTPCIPADPDGHSLPSRRPGISPAMKLLAVLILFNVVLSCFAWHNERFTTNATIYACKPNGTECGWYAAKVIFLNCIEQIWIDPLTLVRSIHIYCREPRYIIPEEFA